MYLEEALRDRFVCRLRSETMQKQLVAVPNLKLQDAMDMATATEAAATNSRVLQQNKAISPASIKRFTSIFPAEFKARCHKARKAMLPLWRGITTTPSVHTKSLSATTATRKLILHAFVMQSPNRNCHSSPILSEHIP